MNRFKERWKVCVGQARRAEGAPMSPPMPDPVSVYRRLGGRRRWTGSGPGQVGGPGEVEAWWRWYGTRGVAVAVILLAGSLLFAGRGPWDASPLRPGVEDAVVEAFWLL